MAAYQIRRLFFDLPRTQVVAIRDKAAALIAEGKTIMAIESGGRRAQKQFSMPPADMLAEAKEALRFIDGTLPPKRTQGRHSSADYCG